MCPSDLWSDHFGLEMLFVWSDLLPVWSDLLFAWSAVLSAGPICCLPGQICSLSGRETGPGCPSEPDLPLSGWSIRAFAWSILVTRWSESLKKARETLA